METTNIKFNGGIWSEVLKGRYDLGNYQSASRTCENFIPTRYGQVEKRSGTKHLGFAKHDDKVCVLHSFQYSVNTKFMLEFGDQYIRFWSNDLQVEVNPSAWVTLTEYVAGDVVTNSGDTYICIIDHQAFNFNTNLSQGKWYLLEGDTLEVPTPYLEAELYELQMRAINDVVYIVHPNHPVGKLIRLADDRWTYAEADLSLPFVDPDVDSFAIQLNTSAKYGTINIESSADVFNADYVGSTLRLKYTTDGDSVSFSDANINISEGVFDPLLSYSEGARVQGLVTGGGKRFLYTASQDYTPTAWVATSDYSANDIITYSGDAYICLASHTATTTTPNTNTSKWKTFGYPAGVPEYFDDGIVTVFPKDVSGQWSLKTTGIWNGTWGIQRSYDNGVNWTTIKIITSTDDSNYFVEEDQDGDLAQIRIVAIASLSTGLQRQTATFSVLSTISTGTAKITSLVDARNVTADVVTTIPETTNTSSWDESAFSGRQGYPRSIAVFDNRLLLAGTAKKPQAFFYSAINAYDNFTASNTLADAPFFVEALSDDQSSIQWLSAQRELFVGTASVEGILSTRKQDEAQSPENLPIVRWNESMGSAHRSAMPMRDSLMCLQRGRTTINMLAYSLERDGYTGEEVSLLCNHLFSSGVQQMAHLREPYTGAYTVQEDGTLCHMVYEPKLQVTAWCKFTTQSGNFESVAVLPSSSNEGSDEDEVWCAVSREINGVTRRHIEHFTVGNRAKQVASDTDNLWYVDAGVKATGSGLTSVTGLDHLEGETVCVLADGIKGEYTVASGAITLSIPADTVIVGLPVTSEFEPLDLEVSFKGGSTHGKRKQLYQSKLMVYKSLGGSVASDGESYQDLVYHTAGELMDESVPLKDGYMEVFHESSHARQKYWRIKHDEPYPFTLQAVLQSFTVSKH